MTVPAQRGRSSRQLLDQDQYGPESASQKHIEKLPTLYWTVSRNGKITPVSAIDSNKKFSRPERMRSSAAKSEFECGSGRSEKLSYYLAFSISSFHKPTPN